MRRKPEPAPAQRFRRRRAVLGLAVLGTAGAFAYRAMFGGSMLPSLPPIIKAEDGPNKIVPNAGNLDGAAANQADATSAGSGEKLVSREEKPVDVPAPVTRRRGWFRPSRFSRLQLPARRARRLRSAGDAERARRPLAQAPAAPRAGASLPCGAHGCLTAPAVPAGRTRRLSALTGAEEGPYRHHPARSAGAAPMPAAADAAVAAPPGARGRGAAAALRRRRPDQRGPGRRQCPASNRSAAGRCGAARAGPHPHRAGAPGRASPAAASEPAAAAGGGYAVQVTSQRSEAEAQAAFRALQAKYPDQLGGRAADRSPRRPRRQGRLLPRAGRSLCLDGTGRRDVLEPEGCRRQLHRPEELRRGSRLTLARGAS